MATDSDLDGIFKIEKIENIHLHNLAKTLENVDIHELARECKRLVFTLTTGRPYEQDTSSETVTGNGQKAVPSAEELENAANLRIAEEKCKEADVLLQKGLLEEARHGYEQALQLNPDDDLTSEKLKKLLEAEARIANAQSKVHQKYSTALERGQGIYAAMQDLNEARKLLPSLTQTERVDKVAFEARTALDTIVHDMLGAALGSKLEKDAAKTLATAINTCKDVINTLEGVLELDASNLRVKAALATAREQQGKFVAIAEKLDKAAALVEEDTDQSLVEARSLLNQVRNEFPDEPKLRLLLEKIRERYLELAAKAAASRDWKLAGRWFSEASGDDFGFLPSHELVKSIENEVKGNRRRAQIVKWGGLAFLLVAAISGGAFLLFVARL